MPAPRRRASVLVLHLEDLGPFPVLQALLEAQGYRYRLVHNPNVLLRAFDIAVDENDRALGDPEAGGARLRQSIKAAKRVIVILDEDLERGTAAQRGLYRGSITGSEVARKLAGLEVELLRYSGCYENDWDGVEQGRGVVYKEDYGALDAARVLAVIKEILDE